MANANGHGGKRAGAGRPSTVPHPTHGGKREGAGVSQSQLGERPLLSGRENTSGAQCDVSRTFSATSAFTLAAVTRSRAAERSTSTGTFSTMTVFLCHLDC